LPQVKHHTLTL